MSDANGGISYFCVRQISYKIRTHAEVFATFVSGTLVAIMYPCVRHKTLLTLSDTWGEICDFCVRHINCNWVLLCHTLNRHNRLCVLQTHVEVISGFCTYTVSVPRRTIPNTVFHRRKFNFLPTQIQNVFEVKFYISWK